jgi:uncharacterized protein YihD (DUF1040 family)
MKTAKRQLQRQITEEFIYETYEGNAQLELEQVLGPLAEKAGFQTAGELEDYLVDLLTRAGHLAN